METMHQAAPTRPRWFAGLRRSRSRMLGGVATGFADFWSVDPMLLRVLLVSPIATGILALMLMPWSEAVMGAWLAVGITQLLWVLSGLVVVGYVVAWILIPLEDRESVARRFLWLGGTSGTLLKFVFVIGALILVAWFGLVLVALGLSILQDLNGGMVGLLLLLGLAGLVALGVWVSRGGDLRDAVVRFGSPGFGRVEPGSGPAARTPGTAHPTEAGRVVGPEDDPRFMPGQHEADRTTVLDPDADPTTVLGPDHDPTTVLGPDHDPTTVLGPDHDPTTVLGPDGDPIPLADPWFAPGEADRTFAYAPASGNDGAPPPWDPAAQPPDAVDRARAAATAAADARAAAAEAERRQRVAENRARRAAARAVRKERNRWGKLVAAVTLLTAGVLFLTDQLALTSLGALQIGVISLALLAGGVLVGAWFGSARWLILPALLLSAVLGAGSFLSATLDDVATMDPVTWTPKALPADQSTWMHWDSGVVTVDLTEAESLDSRSLTLDVDRGTLTVIIPEGQWTVGSSNVALGENHLDSGATTLFASSPIEVNSPSEFGEDDPGPLVLDLNVDIGELNLIQKEA